ncbi:MAG: ribosome-binding factor A [Saprospiraceae bacterium]|jgi:ribosome-binding factor A
MESKRQKQVTEIVKRNFGILLQQEGGLIYGHEVLVTVTSAKMSPDMSIAKIYLSVFNTDNKQEVILLMEQNYHQLKQAFVTRVRKHMRRIPELQFYLDDTLDEMYRLNSLFDKLEDDNQMGASEEEE